MSFGDAENWWCLQDITVKTEFRKMDKNCSCIYFLNKFMLLVPINKDKVLIYFIFNSIGELVHENKCFFFFFENCFLLVFCICCSLRASFNRSHWYRSSAPVGIALNGSRWYSQSRSDITSFQQERFYSPPFLSSYKQLILWVNI